MTRKISLPNMTYEDGKLVFVDRPPRRGKRPMRKKSSKAKIKAAAKAQRAWRP